METEFRTNKEMTYMGFWMRVLAKILDSLVLLPFSLTLAYSQIKNNMHMNLTIYLIYIIIVYSYEIFFVVKFGGTLGKLFTSMRIVTENGQFLSIRQAILRSTIQFIGIGVNLIYYLGIIESKTIITLLYSIILGVDVLYVLSNYKKRAVHDLIADSYVVTKESRLRVLEG